MRWQSLLEPPTYTRLELAQHWPRQYEKARDAVAQLTAERVTACRHVVGGALPGICADHPAAGVQCWDSCLRRHAERHDRDLELTCDQCRQVRDAVQGAVLLWPVPDLLEVRDTRSCRRRIEGFVVVALGACGECRTSSAERSHQLKEN